MKKNNSEIPLSFYYWVQARIYERSHNGYISKEKVGLTLRKGLNIPKRVYNLIIKELQMLGLIIEDSNFFKVTSSDEDVIIKKFENELLYEF